MDFRRAYKPLTVQMIAVHRPVPMQTELHAPATLRYWPPGTIITVVSAKSCRESAVNWLWSLEVRKTVTE